MTEFYPLQIHGDADHDGGLIDAVSALLHFFEELSTPSQEGLLSTLLPGLASMSNLHPLFVHFPIALLSLFWLLDLTGTITHKSNWRETASWLLYAGTLMAGVTVAAGLMAAASVAHSEAVHEIMERHEHIGFSVLFLASALSVWRLKSHEFPKAGANVFFLLLASLLCGLLVLGVDLGGLMVYRYGVAVSAIPVVDNGHQHHHDN